MRKLMPDGRPGLLADRIAPAVLRKRNGTPEIYQAEAGFFPENKACSGNW